MGLGISSEKNFDDGYFFGDFFDFTYQPERGFGFSVSPISGSRNIKDESVSSLVFVNATVFYDFLENKNFSGNFVLGPFATIHLLGNNQLDYFGLQSGLLFSIRKFDENSIFSYNYINFELGYGFTNGTSAFYTQLGIDMVGILALLGPGDGQKAADDYKRDNNDKTIIPKN